MNDTTKEFSKIGFAKTFVVPAVLIFLVPVVSVLFFRHAEGRFDQQVRQAMLDQVWSDRNLTEQERAEAIAFLKEARFSQLITQEEIAATFDLKTRFDYATFRWMIRLSALSILSSVAVFLLAGVCVLLSLRSHLAQYLSLSAGWHVLRIFGALQAIVQGAMLVALSFWITALWFNIYFQYLILIVGGLAVFAVVAVIRAIFRRPVTDVVVAGQVIENASAMPLWNELRSLCAKVGTEPPNQVVAGIDDNFFVTEQPVVVNGETYHGRTLYVSLSLLKQLQGAEASAVLAHEMAHFSGRDTLYSKKISPLLNRYDAYLQALAAGVVTLPIFCFMRCFRALFELSLGRVSREREFRADRIAVETTSSRDFAGALLRIAAYSKYRHTVEQDLLWQEQAFETANVSERIEQGFHDYSAQFASSPDIENLETSHPFDSHPSLSQRFDAMNLRLRSEDTRSLLATPGDGRWYRDIQNATQMERQQWNDFEEQFRRSHEESLPYRFLPETVEERMVVVKVFPKLTFEGKKRSLAIDFEKIEYSNWTEPILYREITKFFHHDAQGVLKIYYVRTTKRTQNIRIKLFGRSQQEIIDAINRYYARYQSAVEYQKQKKLRADSVE